MSDRPDQVEELKALVQEWMDVADAYKAGLEMERTHAETYRQEVACQSAAAAAARRQMAALRAERDALATSLWSVLIGWNHLASALIGWLGAGDGFPPYSDEYETARAKIKDPLIYDAWVCWKSIMQTRDLEPHAILAARDERVRRDERAKALRDAADAMTEHFGINISGGLGIAQWLRDRARRPVGKGACARARTFQDGNVL